MGALVGREAALGSAERFLDVLRHRSAALAIEGEAGIGKTALWLETVAAAEARDYRVLQARPTESEARLAYSGISDLVGGSFDEVRASLPAPQERALAAALLLADATPSAELRATATAFVSSLHQLACRQPVLVAIDDAQWLDPSSEKVLAFAARRLPSSVGLLIAWRSEQDVAPPSLVRGQPEDILERIVLEPLSLAALHHLVADRLGISLPRPTLTRLAASSGGNPLFALEIGRSLDARAGERLLDDALPVPPTLQEMVAARVQALSQPARDAILVAAALSRPTRTAVTEALPAEADGDAALAEAEEAGVIVSDRGRIQFTHPLLSSAVYGLASSATRRQLHRQLAEQVGDVEERARHLAMSTDEPDESTAAELEAAAQLAALRGAQDAAADLFEASWRLTPQGLVDEGARRMLGQSAALNAMGDFAEARSLAERALVATHAPSLRTSALLLLGSIAWFNGDARGATGLAEEALATIAQDPRSQGPIHAQLVRFGFSVDLESALAHADAAVALLSEEREPGLLAHVLVDRFFGSALLGRNASPQLLERGLALEATSLSALAGVPQPMPLLWFHCTDDFEAASARYAMEEQWYRERGEEIWVADRLSHLALVELRAGDWESAERHAEESCAALDRLEVSGPRAMAFEKRSLVDAHRGRIERGRSTLLPLIEKFEAADQGWWAALSLSTLGFLEFAAGDGRAAHDALRRMREHANAVGAKDILFDRSEPFHIEALVALGELDRAEETLQSLEARGRTLPRLWIAATLPRARALVLAAKGDVNAALAAIDDVDGEAASRLPFEFAWTLLVKGQIHRRAKQKRAAADALGQALERFERLGAPMFAERARGELERVGLRRSQAELTPSEHRIAMLAAAGRTNREVAQAAFVSQKTVEANLARVYRKLGIHSRAELGAWMADQRDEPAQT